VSRVNITPKKKTKIGILENVGREYHREIPFYLYKEENELFIS